MYRFLDMKHYSLEEQGVHNRDFVNYQIQQGITRLFKNTLLEVEALKSKNNIPQEDFEHARKRVLDCGNDTIRDIQNLLDVFNFYIDPERLKEARENRKVVKKVVVSGSFEIK